MSFGDSLFQIEHRGITHKLVEPIGDKAEKGPLVKNGRNPKALKGGTPYLNSEEGLVKRLVSGWDCGVTNSLT